MNEEQLKKLLQDAWDGGVEYYKDICHNSIIPPITFTEWYADTKQKLNIHSVSGKRPLDDIIRQAVEMAREESAWLSTQPKYTLAEIQAACASGAVDKTVSGGFSLINFIKWIASGLNTKFIKN